jgi:hypothetical protein
MVQEHFISVQDKRSMVTFICMLVFATYLHACVCNHVNHPHGASFEHVQVLDIQS